MDIVGDLKSGQDVKKQSSAKTYNACSYSPLTLKCSEMALIEAMKELAFINSLYFTL